MVQKVKIEAVYAPSKDVVARDVHGEFIIIPITSGVGDLEDEIFSLNEEGRAIWERLDGKKTLEDVAKILDSEFEAGDKEILKDCAGLVGELLKRRMVVEVN